MSSLLTLVSSSGLLDLALKSTAVLLLALVIVALLSRASAAWRHLLWTLAVVCLLLLPALSLALPAWRVTWLPQWAAAPVAPTAPEWVAPAPPEPIESVAGQNLPPASDPPISIAAATPSPPPLVVQAKRIHVPPSIPWLAICWANGVVLSLLPLAIGLWQLAGLQRRSQVIDDQRWLTLLAELQRQLHVRRNVQLRQSNAALVPLTWGALRPVLLVPAKANAWPDDHRRLVLLHELAHVRRWDWLTQLVAHVACAFYWFHPLVWLAARQMRIERERACDDLVLASGARASDYAEQLLALATSLQDVRLSTLVAVPMARRGALEDRLRGILDQRRSRAALTTAAICLVAALSAAVIAPLAMLRAAPAEKEANKPAADKPAPDKSAPDKSAADKPAAKPPAKTVTIRGKVLDDLTGKPIERIITQAGKFEPAEPTKVTWGYSEGRSSASDGSFSTTVRWDEGWTARILAEGYIPQPVLTSAPPADQDEIEVTIRLKQGPKVRGVVLDHAGRPLKDAAVFAVGPTGVNLSGGQASGSDSQGARTDAAGRFELPIGEAKTLAVSHANFDVWPAEIPATGEVTIRLPEPARVDVDLAIDGAAKESTIFYQFLGEGRPEFKGVRLERELKLANPGKLSLAALPPGRYQICRMVMNNLGEIGFGGMLDRQFFEVKAGETKSIDYVRRTGAKVSGKLTPPAGTKLMGIVVSVRSEQAKKGPFDEHQWRTTFASLAAEKDGSFQTERIAPGKYVLVADAYLPLTPEQRIRSGAILPSFRAEIQIDVPAEGELTVDDLMLKPYKADGHPLE